jgi:predicted nucleic-acid-binding Zn-ribbon protein
LANPDIDSTPALGHKFRQPGPLMYRKQKGVSMKSGKCPKCGSSDVYVEVDMPLKGGPFGSNSIPVSFTSMAPLDNYVCVGCGYVESYVADADQLAAIKRKWSKVGDAQGGTQPS